MGGGDLTDDCQYQVPPPPSPKAAERKQAEYIVVPRYRAALAFQEKSRVKIVERIQFAQDVSSSEKV